MSSKFTTTIQQYADTEDYFIEIPDHILNTLKWKEGDELCWSVKEGKIILTKIKDASESQEEHSETYDWYRAKEEAIKEHLQDIAKDYDEIYDSYIQATNEDTYGDQSNKQQETGTISPPEHFPHFP